MTNRYTGGVISATAPTVSQSGASGVWNLEEAQYYQKAGLWPPGSGADPYFQNTTLLLHGDGTNGAQNNTFVDSSANNFTITRTGNTTQGSFNPYVGPGNWSNYFDGSGDYLTVASIGTITGDFTYECWIYPTSTAALFLPAQFGSETTGRFYAAINTSRTINLEYFGVGTITLSNATVTANTWNHFAITRSGSTMYGFINGALAGSTTSITGTIGNAGSTFIGASSAGTAPITGFISNFRVIAGTALYTAAFTPPTTPLLATTQTRLLTCNNNGFIDQSAANNTLTRNGDTRVSKFSPFTLYQTTPTSYSGYFDGTGDYLTAPASNSTIWPGSGSFTIEYWLYLPANPSAGYYTHFSYGTAGSVLRVFNTAATSKIEVFSGASVILNPAWPTAGQWNHFALVRNGTTLTLYINGAVAQSVTNSTDFSTGTLTIGGESASNPLLGSISNFRIVKGTAVYTSAFTPPTSPLTAISGTSLLTCQSTTFIDNSTNAFTITANGNATPRRANPFTDTVTGPTPYAAATYAGSAYFDGTGDYLVAPSSAGFGFGTGDFTVEAWFYFTGTIATYQRPWWFGDDNDNLELNTSVFRVGGAAQGALITGTTTIKSGTWYHVALTRAGGVYKLWLNGAQEGGSATNSYNSSARTLTVMATSSGANPSTGYVSNLRVIKGTALYTGPFVPPAAPVTAVTNTQLLLNMANAGIYDNTTVNDLETVGSAQVSTSVVKYGTGSIAFDGTGDYLTAPANNALDFGSGDFTIEGWVYLSGNQSSKYLFGVGTVDGATRSVALWIGGTQRIEGYFSADGSTWLSYKTGTTIVAAGQWNHVAFVRSGTTLYLFLNGTSEGTQTGTPTTASSGKTLLIGGQSALYQLNGYLDDIRITKGYARYTANFTPPIQAFPNY